ncbi:MAG: hypothetical protein G01um10148_442 [Parcubacteria group bacterium Gr01-1014_8]|nr:MAG: hypothetical protein G01um10148_442 [Parcubacteria group bacterium Gr01-1014_8]
MDAYVTPTFRGRGIFTSLHSRAEEYLLRAEPIKLIRITVLSNNAEAVHAYKKAGYEPEELIMVKKVV